MGVAISLIVAALVSFLLWAAGSLTVYLIGAFAAIVTYYVCRRMLLQRLRFEKPELFPASRPALIGESVLWGGAFSLEQRLNELGLPIDPASKIWVYVHVLRTCLGLLSFIGAMVVLPIVGAVSAR